MDNQLSQSPEEANESKIQTDESILAEFLSSYSAELNSKVNRLNKLIGEKHWLSVGNYKESILRGVLREAIPKRFEVSTGFILAKGKNGEIIRSKQCDIMIWDSSNYAPIFRDGEFTIIPPESCRVIIEVKGVLTGHGIKDSAENFDSLAYLRNVSALQFFKIRKYIFAYEIGEGAKNPKQCINALKSFYENCKDIPISSRVEELRRNHPNENGTWPLYLLDGIFIRGKFSVIGNVGHFLNENRMIYSQYHNSDSSIDHIYSHFEYEVISYLADQPHRMQGLWYAHQPGLYSIKANILVEKTKAAFMTIIPPITKNQLPPQAKLEQFSKESLVD